MLCGSRNLSLRVENVTDIFFVHRGVTREGEGNIMSGELMPGEGSQRRPSEPYLLLYFNITTGIRTSPSPAVTFIPMPSTLVRLCNPFAVSH